ncbi:MAG TPA: NADPH:quinone oxidoreductase family protein [Acidimicrobiales bacterium]|nr:NADPH:quinone oxidoreductase family protein [Acidimicrobiales bacterium]
MTESHEVRKVVCAAYGPPEELTVEAAPLPEPGAGQVRIAVRAAGVNYVDNLFVSGEYQIKIPPPFTPGGEVAGTVDVVGAGVEGWTVGARVVASVGVGGWASHVVVDARHLIAVPDRMSDGQAATFVQSYATAWFSLTKRVTVHEGDHVLVLGAGGGLGLAFTDVATALGGRVIAAASSDDKLDAAEAVGAIARIDYEAEDLKPRARELSGGGVDLVVDPVGDRFADPALRALGFDGTYLVLGFAAGEIPCLPANQILLRNRRVAGVDWGAWAMENPAENRELLDELFDRVGRGSLHPSEPTTAPLDDVSNALRRLLDRQITGKLALIP